jgi:hypothetical protein
MILMCQSEKPPTQRELVLMSISKYLQKRDTMRMDSLLPATTTEMELTMAGLLRVC